MNQCQLHWFGNQTRSFKNVAITLQRQNYNHSLRRQG